MGTNHIEGFKRSRSGLACQGMAWRGEARRGKAGRGKARFVFKGDAK